MGQDVTKILACCQKAMKDLKIDIIIEKGCRLIGQGLAVGGTVFLAALVSSRNTKPNPNQKENYVNPDQNAYNPGFYSITPKPMESHFDDRSAREKV